jgi:S-adenosylmethionine synthetase
MKKDFMFISESVTEGHPDKLCDQISDSIVDRFLQQDPNTQVIAECAVSTSIVFVAGRYASEATVDMSNVARTIIERVGYEHKNFNSTTCSVLTSIAELPVDEYYKFNEFQLSDEEVENIPVKQHATVFGFACKQTPALMPLPIWLAHKVAKRLTEVRKEKILPYLTPDAKTQVGVEYKNRMPYRIHTISIIASQSKKKKPPEDKLKKDIQVAVIEAVFQDEDIKPDKTTRVFVNPYGKVVLGGPSMHAGLTGRKTAIDTYGEYSRHSGAALSGKDPLRIDRVGAYAARYAAKNVVAANLAEECEVQLSYSIGLSRPVSIQVETFGTGKMPDEMLASLIEKHFDFRLAGIVRQFQLRRMPSTVQGGFYSKLAAYGHVGRLDMELPWEAVDKVEALVS